MYLHGGMLRRSCRWLRVGMREKGAPAARLARGWNRARATIHVSSRRADAVVEGTMQPCVERACTCLLSTTCPRAPARPPPPEHQCRLRSPRVDIAPSTSSLPTPSPQLPHSAYLQESHLRPPSPSILLSSVSISSLAPSAPVFTVAPHRYRPQFPPPTALRSPIHQTYLIVNLSHLLRPP